MAEPWEMNWPSPAAGTAAKQPWEMDWAPPKPEPTTSPVGQMLVDLGNQGVAAGQRTTPVISAHMPNLISNDVHENDAGEAMYIDPKTGDLAKTDSNKHVILRDPADNRLKVFARTPETNEGAAASLGRVLAPGMAAGNIRTGPTINAIKTAPEAIAAADRIDVPLPKLVATDSPLTAFTGQVLARAPGGGPIVESMNDLRGNMQGAVGRAAEMAGGSTDPAVAGASFRGGIENSFKPMVKSGVGAAYDNVASVMDKNVKTPLSSTQGIAEEIIARRSGAAIQGESRAATEVLDAVTRPGGMNFDQIKNLRTHVGELLEGKTFPEGMSEHELRAIYAGLSKDLEAAAVAGGGERGLAAFKRANELASNVADWKESLKKVLGSQSRSDEGVATTIIRMAGREGGDVDALVKARTAVPPEVWQDIASTAIGRLGIGRNGEWTAANFATDFRNMSERGRALLFRSVGQGDVLPYLEDIAKVSQKIVDRGKLANTSGTAGHNALYAAGGAILTGIGAGRVIEPLAAIGGIVGANGLSRLLAAKASAASANKWVRAYAAFAERQTPATYGTLEMTTRNLSNTAAATAGLKIEPGELMKAIQMPSADGEQDVPRPPTSQ